MVERYPVGTRVVLVEDHRWNSTFGRNGQIGTTVGPFNAARECVIEDGGYTILFDNTDHECWVNASAVAELNNGYSDADLAMALDLANLLDEQVFAFGSYIDQWRVAAWLREQALNEIKARVR